MIRSRLTLPVALVAAMIAALPALAHHGWAWTEDEESRLAGTIEAMSLGNPHAYFDIAAEDGVWRVDLAPPSATARSGLVEGVAAVGDTASFTGHRSRDRQERVFKAETVTVNGKTYDVYPRREKTLTPGA